MKSLRLDRWACQLQPPRNPRLYLLALRCPFSAHNSAPLPQRTLRRAHHHQTPQWQSQRREVATRRNASTVAAAEQQDGSEIRLERGMPKLYRRVELDETPTQGGHITEFPDFPGAGGPLDEIQPNFPIHGHAKQSAKLAALHARLSLPAKLPLQTLARCLIDPSVDNRAGYNNAPLAILGQDLLGYFTSENIICRYPRIPMPVLFAAQYAYVGPATLASMRAEWGVEVVAAPGPEVDPGLLQLKRMPPGNALAEDGTRRAKDVPQVRTGSQHYRRGMSSRIVYDDQFGDPTTGTAQPAPEHAAPYPGAPISTSSEETSAEADAEASEQSAESSTTEEAETEATTSESTEHLTLQRPTSEHHMNTEPTTVEAASAGFVRALTGALYLHAGTQAVKDFHKAHVLSRHLELHKLFNFKYPTRDLSRLCAREGFEPPVARLISETGRLSRTPVFIVGVFSGDDKLGEGTGASLNEGRTRAAAAALRSWYLYSPPDTDIMFPSDVEGVSAGKKAWKPQMIDIGEIVT